jgi:hypothetical protein
LHMGFFDACQKNRPTDCLRCKIVLTFMELESTARESIKAGTNIPGSGNQGRLASDCKHCISKVRDYSSRAVNWTTLKLPLATGRYRREAGAASASKQA